MQVTNLARSHSIIKFLVIRHRKEERNGFLESREYGQVGEKPAHHIYRRNKMIRHGELLIVPVGSIPTGGEVSEHSSFIAGHSETGHHHVLTAEVMEKPLLDSVTEATEAQKFKVHKFTDKLFVDLIDDAQLRHEKTGEHAHETVSVPAGRYEIRQKQEYDFRANAMRQVWD